MEINYISKGRENMNDRKYCRNSNSVLWGVMAYAVLVVGISASALSAQTTWTTVAFNSCTSAELRGIVYGNGEYVVVGDSGTILTSPNGSTWTKQTSGIDRELYSIAWGNNLFVAVADAGIILTSPNGTTWTLQASGTTNWLHAVIWANDQFIVVGGNSTILTSPNGTTWTNYVSPCTCDLLGIAYGGQPATYVAVGGYMTPSILTSTNGISWNTQTTSATSHMLNAVTWNGIVFAAVGDSGTILTSPDGATWTSHVAGTAGLLSDIVWLANQFVIVGHEGMGICGPILTSPTGIAWTGRISSTTQWLYGVGWGDNLFVAVGTDGTIITSPTAATGIVTIASPSQNQEAVRISGSVANYKLAAAGHVSMKLFDFQGRLVSVLLDREQAAGAYTQSIRPPGANLPFGKYIVDLKIDEASLEQPVFLGQ